VKWRIENLREAFCANRACDVRVWGNIRTSGDAPPSNWTLFPLAAIELNEFLAGLDFCVCWPRRDASGMIDLVPIAAMARGIPVVLSPRLRSIYGDAALYADANEVFDVMRHLWKSENDYKEQILRGTHYVEVNCSYRKFGERMEPYLRGACSHQTQGSRTWRLYRWLRINTEAPG
jgi:hypothetical protein